MGDKEIELTILMPCLNEAETLEICIKKANAFLKENKVKGEVLIADNGSNDGSQEIALKNGARVANIEEKGYGSALRGGCENAYGKYVIMGDADDSYNFSELMPFLEKLREGYELVMGNRFKGGIAKGAMPPLHREAVSNSGYYENAQMANTFYNQVNSELEAGFNSGKLTRRTTMPSALMSPWRNGYWEELPKAFIVTLHYVVGFEAVETNVLDSMDDGSNGIRLFERVTNKLAQYPGEETKWNDQIRVEIVNSVTMIYQLFGVLIFLLSGVVYGCIFILVILKKWREKYHLLDVWLVLSALLFSAFVLMIGVAYTDISAYVAISYWYLAGAYPLIIAFNVIALYTIIEIIMEANFGKNSEARKKHTHTA